jgi:hypothetical protein
VPKPKKAFTRAVKAGAKVRTKTLPGGKYTHVAVRPGGKKGPKGGRTVGTGCVHKKKSK